LFLVEPGRGSFVEMLAQAVLVVKVASVTAFRLL